MLTRRTSCWMEGLSCYLGGLLGSSRFPLAITRLFLAFPAFLLLSRRASWLFLLSSCYHTALLGSSCFLLGVYSVLLDKRCLSLVNMPLFLVFAVLFQLTIAAHKKTSNPPYIQRSEVFYALFNASTPQPTPAKPAHP